jgi:glycosyltransferase involved in cell wall biosynthesis
MSEPTPRVTLGVTTCNVERYLAGAFDSVLAQDYTDFEVVVCDNASIDSTWEICRRYAAKDSRFRIFQNATNIGEAGNFARVVSLARGELFRLTAHDDLLAPTLLSRCVEAMDAEPTAIMAYPRSIIIDDDGEEQGTCPRDAAVTQARPSGRVRALMTSWALCNEIFGLIRTAELRKTRLLSPTLPSADRRVLMELVVRGRFLMIDEPLFYRRVGRTSSYGGDRGGPIYAWLEPELARKAKIPKKFAKMNGDANRLLVETVKALLANDLPLATRLSTATTYATATTARRARVTLGRWRRQLIRRS